MSGFLIAVIGLIGILFLLLYVVERFIGYLLNQFKVYNEFAAFVFERARKRKQTKN